MRYGGNRSDLYIQLWSVVRIPEQLLLLNQTVVTEFLKQKRIGLYGEWS